MSTSDRALLICDLTQSYASHGGGGVTRFLREKRRHILERTGHRLLQIVPGEQDRVIEQGRHIWVEVGAKPVRGSPNYRFILRTRAVREILERYRPDVIESLCPWVLPWTAIHYRRAHPATALVAGYHTDFPNAHVHRVGTALFGKTAGAGLRAISVGYAGVTYREFDRIYTLDATTAGLLGSYGLTHVDVLDLGVDTTRFAPERRDSAWRAKLLQSLGISGDGPLLVYAGRIDNEKRADRLVAMMRELPPELGAGLVMLGDGKLRAQLTAETAGLPISLPGFVGDRAELARALASCDIYVSAMADETFGISVIEAQASGLPVVGVASGAMPARVPPGLGLLGPVDDVATMARNVALVWDHERAAEPAGMGRAARAHVLGRYSWERTFDHLIHEVYAKALVSAERRTREPRGWLQPGLVRSIAARRAALEPAE